MAGREWQSKIDIREDWKLADERQVTPEQLGQRIAEKLRHLPLEVRCQDHDDLEWIIDDLEGIAPDATFDDFDIVLETLYDWADVEKRCWITTF